MKRDSRGNIGRVKARLVNVKELISMISSPIFGKDFSE